MSPSLLSIKRQLLQKSNQWHTNQSTLWLTRRPFHPMFMVASRYIKSRGTRERLAFCYYWSSETITYAQQHSPNEDRWLQVQVSQILPYSYPLSLHRPFWYKQGSELREKAVSIVLTLLRYHKTIQHSFASKSTHPPFIPMPPPAPPIPPIFEPPMPLCSSSIVSL